MMIFSFTSHIISFTTFNFSQIINSEKRLKDIKKENMGNNDKIDKIDEKEENKKCEIF